ncbi:MAG: DUF2120 domain-containing protein [Methanobrevibacter sp.]|jgi:hypothetical protein|nr:DUF2120 domain-containing protein [Candidatus Methanoflexus mossambicus]
MVKLHRTAQKIMKFLDAFKGSRPALDSQFILIVRSISALNISVNDFKKTLDDLIVEIDGKEIGEFSKSASALLNRMDEQIRSNVHVGGYTDAGGIERMKKSLEELNVATEYRLLKVPKMGVGVFVVIWKDKTDQGPLFVEIVVSDDEDTDNEEK